MTPETAPYPLILEPLLKPRVWGGRSLSRLGKELPTEPIGESWELADLPDRIPDGRNSIANGAWKGLTLREVIHDHERLVMGRSPLSSEGGFPLLIKYLDAQENLSVQVHPTPEYVEEHPGTDVKNECWLVLAAQPGAVIYKGVRPGVTAEQFRSRLGTEDLVSCLNEVPARAGDFHDLPSGICHALGAGVMVAEVQTPSDTTFRVYDWGREGRELHLEQAMACIAFGDGSSPDTEPPIVEMNGVRTTRLVDGADFTVERVECETDVTAPIVTNDVPIVVMLLDGRLDIHGAGTSTSMTTGDTALLPAALTAADLRAASATTYLHVTPPSPLRSMLA